LCLPRLQPQAHAYPVWAAVVGKYVAALKALEQAAAPVAPSQAETDDDGAPPTTAAMADALDARLRAASVRLALGLFDEASGPFYAMLCARVSILTVFAHLCVCVHVHRGRATADVAAWHAGRTPTVPSLALAAEIAWRHGRYKAALARTVNVDQALTPSSHIPCSMLAAGGRAGAAAAAAALAVEHVSAALACHRAETSGVPWVRPTPSLATLITLY
jgi:hypothetical protein